MKRFIVLLFLLLTTNYQLPTVYAQEEYFPNVCPAPNITSCEEFQNAVNINWTNTSFVSQYTLYWNDTPTTSTSCPSGSPPSKCGSIVINLPANQKQLGKSVSQLITGLTNLKRYHFILKQTDAAPGCDGVAPSYISCTPNVCGDNYKGLNEVCDGTDVEGKTCGDYGYIQNPKQIYEGGNLTCNNSCTTISTSSCTTCNSFTQDAVTLSTAPYTNNITKPGSTFKCFVDAAKSGPCVACRIHSSYSPFVGGVVSLNPPQNCTFKAWGGSRAEFDCTAPTDTKPIYYYLSAFYPISNDSTTSGEANCSWCTYDFSTQTLSQTKQYDNATVRVVESETTPPTVTILESWQEDLNNLSKYKNVTVEARCNDGDDKGSGCYGDSIKLKRFDTKPTACPTDYTAYDLKGPQSASTKIIWFCGAAKDNFGNTGFSTAPFELRPGCRDQCQIRNEKTCTYYNLKTSFDFDASSTCTNIDSDACYEWGSPEQCSSDCFNGVCIRKKEPIGWGNVWHDKNGDGVKDSGDSGIQGISISYSNNYEGGGATSNSDGIFVMRAERSGDFAIKPTVPPLWKLTKTICQYYGAYCSEDYCPANRCSPPIVNDLSSNCTLSFSFNSYYNSSDLCNMAPDLNFGFARIDTTDDPPAFGAQSPAVSPTKPNSSRKTTISASATDDQALKTIEIYLNGALAKRCLITLRISGPVTTGSCSYESLLAEGSYDYYAIAFDDLGARTVSDTKTFTVEIPPATSVCYQATEPRAEGLITVGNTASEAISGKFGNNIGGEGVCVLDPKAAFVPFKIPTYDDLKSLYFDQSKAAKAPITKDLANQGDLTSSTKEANVIFASKDLEINGNMLQNTDKPILVFVKEKLSIKKDINYAENSQAGGLVFVTGGDVIIDKDVNKINAVIISQGKIYTAGADCTNTNPVTANQLVINGSLISLDPEKKIEFCRTLSGDQNATTAAEKINAQPKYLVILRNLISDTLQRWSEIP